MFVVVVDAVAAAVAVAAVVVFVVVDEMLGHSGRKSH